MLSLPAVVPDQASLSLFDDRAGTGLESFSQSSTLGSPAVVPGHHQELQLPNCMSDDINIFSSSSFNPQYPESVSDDIEPDDIELDDIEDDVKNICRSHGLSDDAINDAKFEKGEEKSLLKLVLNQHCMAQILVTLGFQVHLDDTYMGSKAITFMDRMILAKDIVTSFRWSANTYRNKATWFGWAKEAAKS